MLIATPTGTSPVVLTKLAQARWAMEPPGTRSRDWAVATCRAAGFEPNIACESIDVLLHARLVAQAHAVAFLPALASTHATGCTLAPSGSHRTIHLGFRRGSQTNPAICAARTALRAVADHTVG